MDQINTFLAAKGMNTANLTADQAKAIAKALGFSTPKVRVESYTPKSGGKGTGMYLIAATPGSREAFFRLCDGEALTPEGKATAESLAQAIRDAIA